MNNNDVNPLLKMKTPEEVVASTEQAMREREEQDKLHKERFVDSLTKYIRTGFDVAKRFRASSNGEKISIDDRFMQSKRQVECVYDPEVLQAIEATGGSQEYDPLSIQKCLTMEAWIKDIQSSMNGKLFELAPTPIPEMDDDISERVQQKAMRYFEKNIPESVKIDESDEAADYIGDTVMNKASEMYDQAWSEKMKEAKVRASRMDTVIFDQLVDGRFHAAFNDFLEYFSRSPIGVIKGPIVKLVKDMAFHEKENLWSSEVKVKEQKTFYAPDPMNMYFSPNCLHQDSGDIFEIMPLQASSLQDMIGIKSYNVKAIRKVLKQAANGSLREWTKTSYEEDTLKDLAPQDSEYSGGGDSYNGRIDAVDFWGKVPGEKLREWGMTSDNVPDLDKYYDVHAILIKDFVILAELNSDMLGQRPYAITSVEKRAGSIYGRGIPEKVRPAQKAANMTRRSLINNIALSSGPQAIVNVDMLAEGSTVTKVVPFKVWQSKYIQGASQKAVDFFVPPSLSNELIAVLEKFYNDGDRDSGIPRYVQGDPAGAMRGASSTASGLAMMMNAATKSMKSVNDNIDNDVIKRIVHYLYRTNMVDPDVPEDAKGDFMIRVKGSLALSMKEQETQRRQVILQTILSNETLMGIVGKEGITALLRSIVKEAGMPEVGIVPNDMELEAREENEFQKEFANVIQKAVELGVVDEQAAQLLLNPEMLLQQEAGGSPSQQGGGGGGSSGSLPAMLPQQREVGPDGQPMRQMNVTPEKMG